MNRADKTVLPAGLLMAGWGDNGPYFGQVCAADDSCVEPGRWWRESPLVAVCTEHAADALVRGATS